MQHNIVGQAVTLCCNALLLHDMLAMHVSISTKRNDMLQQHNVAAPSRRNVQAFKEIADTHGLEKVVCAKPTLSLRLGLASSRPLKLLLRLR